MQYEDAGEYTCEAVNVIEGEETSHNQTITVRVKGGEQICTDLPIAYTCHDRT